MSNTRKILPSSFLNLIEKIQKKINPEQYDSNNRLKIACMFFSKGKCGRGCECTFIHLCIYCWDSHSAAQCPFTASVDGPSRGVASALFNACGICDNQAFPGPEHMALHMNSDEHKVRREQEFNILKVKNPTLQYPPSDKNATKPSAEQLSKIIKYKELLSYIKTIAFSENPALITEALHLLYQFKDKNVMTEYEAELVPLFHYLKLPESLEGVNDNDLVKQLIDRLSSSAEKIPTLSSDPTVHLSIKCSGNKLRLIFTGKFTDTLLEEYFKNVFKDKNNKIGLEGTSYSVKEWGRAVKIEQQLKQLEWWFPLHVFKDSEINTAIEKILAPLNLPFCDIENIKKYSIDRLGHREYVTAVDRLSVSANKISVAICQAFCEYTQSFCARAESDPDQVICGNENLSSSRFLGVGIFGVAASSSSQPVVASASSTSSSATSAYSTYTSYKYG